MSGFSLGRRSDDRLRKGFVFFHPVRHRFSAEDALAGFVFAQGMSGQVTADHHLDADGFAQYAQRHVGMWHGHLPVGHDVTRRIQKVTRQLIEHLALVRDRSWQDMVKCRDTVRRYGHHDVIDIIDVPDLAPVKTGLTGK